MSINMVVPYIGTWIETRVLAILPEKMVVVPYIGTWIETRKDEILSNPSLGRTLYRYVDWNAMPPGDGSQSEGRTLYRYVDWNKKLETQIINLNSRTLYRYVDWNSPSIALNGEGNMSYLI